MEIKKSKKTAVDVNAIRKLIKKHKKNDLAFAALGMFVIASLTITLIILFLDFSWQSEYSHLIALDGNHQNLLIRQFI